MKLFIKIGWIICRILLLWLTIIQNATFYFWSAYWKLFSFPSLDNIRNDSKALEKIPVHIGLVFAEEEIFVAEVASLLSWCIAVGISCISLYDINGKLRQSQKHLEQELGHRSPEQSNFQNIHFINSVTNMSTEGPGALPPHSIQVHLLDRSSGKSSLCDVTKQLCQLTAEGQIKLSNITVNTVDECLRNNLGFPDPDLVLVFGPNSSLHGFLPWHVRLSEIMFIPSHYGIRFQHFHEKLKEFSKTQQRFGK